MKSALAALALSTGLFFSAELGGNILSTDVFLWSAAPAHAYGLLAFVAVDLILIVALWDRVRYGGTLPIVKYVGALCVAMASVQFFAMVGDLSGLQPPLGMPASAFRSYLLSDRLYMRLLVLQPVVAGLGFWFSQQNGAHT
ncbi:MAG: hypothetical protein KGI38_03250 [Thaumarchaeota archaeon]|nr:hypothetical protein [Nitrososphaerota archaeon]